MRLPVLLSLLLAFLSMAGRAQAPPVLSSRFGLRARLFVLKPPADAGPNVPPIVATVKPRPEWTVPLELYPLYAPDRIPEDPDPGIYRALLSSPWLVQRRDHHILRMMAEESTRLDEGGRPVVRAIGLGAYLWQNLDADEGLHDGIIWLLRPQEVGVRDVTVGPIIGALIRRFRPFVGLPEPSPEEVGVDLWLHSNASYNAAANIERVLLNAYDRGLRAIAIADYDTLDGARHAVEEAARLRAEGKLGEDFSVIVGEQISSTDASILGLFLRERVLQGMTARATIEAIHEQDGLALLIDPGSRNGVKLLKTLPFDGAVLSHGLHDLYRGLMLLDDPALTGKIWLYSSDARTADAVGWNFSVVSTTDHTPEGIKQAMREGLVCPCGNAYLALIVVLGTPPVKAINRAASQAQEAVESIEMSLENALGADNVEIELSWVKELQDAAGLVELGPVVRRFANGEGPLTRYPKVLSLGVSYGDFRITYDEPSSSVYLRAAGRF